MKKSLLILGLLAVCGIANAADNTTMNVNAKVVGSALEVNTTAVNFGEIAKNATKSQPDTPGRVSISGDANSRVSVTILNTYNGTADGAVVLSRVTDPSDYRKLTYTPYYTVNGTQITAGELQHTGITLDGNGSKEINVAGTLQAPKDIEVGDYSAQMTIKVAYKLH